MANQKENNSELLKAMVLTILSRGYIRFGARMPEAVERKIYNANEAELNTVWEKVKGEVDHQEMAVQPRLPHIY